MQISENILLRMKDYGSIESSKKCVDGMKSSRNESSRNSG